MFITEFLTIGFRLGLGVVKFNKHGVVQAVIGLFPLHSPISSADDFLVCCVVDCKCSFNFCLNTVVESISKPELAF